ncbi:MAG: H-X9-DG-CTERM domain-containing protein [Victivallis sp.]
MDILKGAVWRHSGGANIGMGDGHVEFRHARSIPKLGGDDPFWFYTK